jgi:predicted Zn-dependent protease
MPDAEAERREKRMFKVDVKNWLVAAVAGLTIIAFQPAGGFAAGDEPKPKEPQPEPKPKNKDTGALREEQIYTLGYWQAKSGEHAAALATLRSAANQSDPRIQTMIGFSLRKLGRVEEAMTYYHKVLATHPERTNTRQYLGEAFLQLGQPAKARDQLAEIGKRCGIACEDYRLLADEIAKFEKTAG